MIFEVDKIHDGSFDFKLNIEKSRLAINHPDCALSEDVAITGTLRRIKQEVQLNGQVKTVLSLICSRCLASIKYPVACNIFTRFVPDNPAKKWEHERELHEEDVDTEFYVENKIDITHSVHDNIVLAVPIVSLCKRDCLGLCDSCGANLNNGPCGCVKADPIDPRLEILKKLKNGMK